MHLRYTHLVLALGMLFTDQANAQLFGKKEPPKPLVLEANTHRAEALLQLIDDGAALRHVPKPYAGPAKPVALSSVTVEFITDTEASTKAMTSGSGVSTVQTAVNYKLKGVRPEAMQAIADAFAEHLRKAITDQGYTVLEQEKLLANAAFAASVAESAATPTQASSTLFSKNGSLRITAKGTADTSGMSGAFKDIALSKAMQEALVVKANIVLNFAQLKDTSSVFKGHKVEVEHSVQSSVSGGSLAVMQETGSVGLGFLRAALLPSPISSKVTKLDKTAGEMGATVLIMMLNKGAITGTDNYEVTAIDNYADVMKADLKILAEVMATGLKKQ